jgi:hypothetical protein
VAVSSSAEPPPSSLMFWPPPDLRRWPSRPPVGSPRGSRALAALAYARETG